MSFNIGGKCGTLCKVRPITFLVWHWLTIFGIWIYHNEKMWHVHSWSRFDVDLWPQGQIQRLLSCLHVRPVTSVCFDIGIPYLAHILSPWEDVSSTFERSGCTHFICGLFHRRSYLAWAFFALLTYGIFSCLWWIVIKQ